MILLLTLSARLGTPRSPRHRSLRLQVFVQKKHVASWVRDQLEKSGVRCADIHGDRSQGQREAALKRFREGSIEVLVATDVASRGIDVPEVAHVVQFDLPVSRDEMDSYVHRIGRTGRAGREGKATALFVPGDEPKVGNGALWPDIARIFDENAQEVPVWFDECKPRGAAPRANSKLPPPPPPVSTRRRGASDNRRARRAAAAAAAGRPPNAGPPKLRPPTAGVGRSAAAGPLMRILPKLGGSDGDGLSWEARDTEIDNQAWLPAVVQLGPICLAIIFVKYVVPTLVLPTALVGVLAFILLAFTDEDE